MPATCRPVRHYIGLGLAVKILIGPSGTGFHAIHAQFHLAETTGHALNNKLLRALLAQQEAWELVTFEGEGDKAPIAYYDNGLVLA